MHIYVKVLRGFRVTLNVKLRVEPSDTVKMHFKKKILPCKQQLVFSERKLVDDCTLASYDIQEESSASKVASAAANMSIQ
uniref:Ubiquitin-like domain-containing protein n=1 Tax=Oryza punctata TaxID=4537 RepID=A0A0E0M944_ORYPU